MAYVLIFIIIAIAIAIIILKEIFGEGSKNEKERPKYQYKRKQFFLTRAEHECYNALVAAIGNEYHVFAQAHLPTLVDHMIRGQDWRAALAHINRKSVDFVLCDKAYISPKLAIELDDQTHERLDRKERDEEVERILHYAGVPLLRIKNNGNFNPDELAAQIKETLK